MLYNWCAAVDTFNTTLGETSKSVEFKDAPDVNFIGNRRGICPQGWHVPGKAEWLSLTSFLGNQNDSKCGGNSNNVAKALAATSGWNNSTASCAIGNDQKINNTTGFSAVPAGNYSGSCNGFGLYTDFWSATQTNSGNAFYMDLYYNYPDVLGSDYVKNYGCSVRCLKD